MILVFQGVLNNFSILTEFEINLAQKLTGNFFSPVSLNWERWFSTDKINDRKNIVFPMIFLNYNLIELSVVRNVCLFVSLLGNYRLNNFLC